MLPPFVSGDPLVLEMPSPLRREPLLGVNPASGSLFIPLTDPNPGACPELTGVNGRPLYPPTEQGVPAVVDGASVISASILAGVPTDAARADEALIAGESGPKLLPLGEPFFCTWAPFIGVETGEEVMGPPNSASICCWTPGFADLTHSSYGCK
jgi:hypothetical protein